MNRLDGLGRRVVDIIEGDDVFTAVSSKAVAGTLQQQRTSVQRAAQQAQANAVILDGNGLNKKQIVFNFTLGLVQDSRSPNLGSGEDSYYRVACEALRHLERVVLMVQGAQYAEREALSMLSRIAGFARRNNLVFKVILIGDIPQLTENAFYTGIRVDRFIPRKTAAVAFDERSRQMFSVAEFSQAV
ncbi:MAG: hypothetical protein HKN50_11065 [Gammaproteobacteria bacterium]|nr:hypothetical protein [Gammaproteobacteria bacterium]